MTLLTAAQRRRSLIVLGLFWFLNGVEYAVIIPTAWKYLQSLGAEQSWYLSLTLSSFSIASFIFSPMYGRLSDTTVSPKKLMVLSNLFEMAGNLVRGCTGGCTCDGLHTAAERWTPLH
eukprot:m.94378 g.94378  ORF g.94378 m.94378 type:complete len:118 (+) comp15121_c1_seq3:60-413(+)